MRDINMSSIRSIDRAIDILEAFSIEKAMLSVDELSRMTLLPNSTVYRILCTLEGRGLVQFDEKTLLYKPGLRLLQFSSLVSSVLDVQKEAEELLIDLHLKTAQTVLMAVRDDDHILYIFKKEKSEGLKFSSVVGQRRPFIYGILGPVLLAFLPSNEINRILVSPIVKHTPYTITNQNQIRERLIKIKEEKVYSETNETNIGVTGIGAPVFGSNGEVVVAIGIVGPSILMDHQMEILRSLIIDTSRNISKKMGYPIN
jgi:IclR family KDG regulon transcriptional repressor